MVLTRIIDKESGTTSWQNLIDFALFDIVFIHNFWAKIIEYLDKIYYSYEKSTRFYPKIMTKFGLRVSEHFWTKKLHKENWQDSWRFLNYTKLLCKCLSQNGPMPSIIYYWRVIKAFLLLLRNIGSTSFFSSSDRYEALLIHLSFLKCIFIIRYKIFVDKT